MNKGNCKHKLSDMLLLVILARACGCETRKDIVAFGTIHLSYLQDHLGILAKGYFAGWKVESTTLLWPLWFRHYHENTCRSMMEQTDGTLQLTASSCWVRKLATDVLLML